MSKAVRVYANLLDVVLVVNVDGVGLILRHEDIPCLRDQLNAMFPPEPVEAPAKVEAGVDADAPRFFTDRKDGTEHPYLIKDQWTCREVWFSANELTQLYTELQAHFGDAQNSTNPDQVDTPINWAARRWEAASACMATLIAGDADTTYVTLAEISINAADALIAHYRAEPSGGDE